MCIRDRLNADEIVTHVATESTEVNDEEDDQPIQPAISHKDAIQSLAKQSMMKQMIIKGQNKTDDETLQAKMKLPKIISLRQIHNFALGKYGRQKRQKKSTDFFTTIKVFFFSITVLYLFELKDF